MRRGPASGRRRLQADDGAVSEVLGVVMLLAMVITIMGGVWVFLNPYLTDFEDNTNWNSATGIADRIEDRIKSLGTLRTGPDSATPWPSNPRPSARSRTWNLGRLQPI